LIREEQTVLEGVCPRKKGREGRIAEHRTDRRQSEDKYRQEPRDQVPPLSIYQGTDFPRATHV